MALSLQISRMFIIRNKHTSVCIRLLAVSYTHLDVYKRQPHGREQLSRDFKIYADILEEIERQLEGYSDIKKKIE